MLMDFNQIYLQKQNYKTQRNNQEMWRHREKQNQDAIFLPTLRQYFAKVIFLWILPMYSVCFQILPLCNEFLYNLLLTRELYLIQIVIGNFRLQFPSPPPHQNPNEKHVILHMICLKNRKKKCYPSSGSYCYIIQDVYYLLRSFTI